jgi:hypothetical protein
VTRSFRVSRPARLLSRRALLRGAGGAALGLPLLEIMHGGRARAQEALAPQRFLVWTTPNGTVTDNWRPIAGASETDFQLSEILSPLAAHQSDLVVVQHLRQKGAYGHHCITSLTGRSPIDRGFPDLVATGISLDQHLAKQIGQETPVPSLQLGVQVKQNRDTVAAVSWNEQLQPMPAENNPYLMFSKLFSAGGSASAEENRQLLLQKRSVLDSVKEQGTALNGVLGAADRAVVGNYLDSIRDLEQRLIALEQAQAACATPVLPTDPSESQDKPMWLEEANVPQVIDVYRRLIVAAFSCDITRIVTLNLSSDGGAYRTNNWVEGIDHGKDWHGHSHEVEVGDRASLTAIDQWYYGQLARFVDDFKAVPEGDGTLLSSSLILVNNEYGPNGPVDYLPLSGGSSPNNLTHQAVLMPYVLLGQAGGKLKTGRNLVYEFEDDGKASRGEGRTHTQLLVSLLNLMGLPDQTFGDPEAMQGPLPGLIV